MSEATPSVILVVKAEECRVMTLSSEEHELGLVYFNAEAGALSYFGEN